MLASTLRISAAVHIVGVAALVAPLFPGLFPGYTGFHFVLTLTVSLIVLSFLVLRLPARLPIPAVVYAMIFVGLTAIAIGAEAGWGDLSWRDLFELARPFYLLVFFAFGYSTVAYSLSVGHANHVWIRFYYRVFLLLVVFGIVEATTGFGRDAAFLLYKREYKEIIADKAVGSFGITYHFGYFLLLPIFCFLGRYLMSGKGRYIVLFALSAVCLMLTQSRSLILALAVGLILLFFLPSLYRLGMARRAYLVAVPILACVGIVIYVYWGLFIQTFSYAYEGLSWLFRRGVDISGHGEGSANIRIAQMIWAIEHQWSIPVVGAGIGKEEILLESVYALYYYRYGWIGCAAFAALLIIAILRSSRISMTFHRAKDHAASSFYFGLAMFFLLSPLALISSASHDTPRLGFVFYSCLGLLFATSQRLRVAAMCRGCRLSAGRMGIGERALGLCSRGGICVLIQDHPTQHRFDFCHDCYQIKRR